VGGERITYRTERQAGPPGGPPIRRPAGPGQRQAARASPPRPAWRVALVVRQAAAQDALLLSDKHLVATHIAQHILTQAQQRDLLK